MKLINTTDFADHFLRRMVSWCCRELELPPSYVRGAAFRRARHAWGGLAYLSQRRIGVRIGKPEITDQPLKHWKFGDGFAIETTSQIEVLVVTTAHELAHLDLYRRGNKSRGHGKGHGGSERLTEGRAARVLDAFRHSRELLLTDWSHAPAERKAKPVATAQEKRAAKAMIDLARWQRKLKLAQTKCRKLKQRAAYYEKTLAAKRSG